ncbi:hypothetical protein RvVAT039_pl01440 (plasmid) [Agrobacterium vitis]|nr:hypothetical protein RvVAT039_pl01440 [Agrobacterium vitis]
MKQIGEKKVRLRRQQIFRDAAIWNAQSCLYDQNSHFAIIAAPMAKIEVLEREFGFEMHDVELLLPRFGRRKIALKAVRIGMNNIRHKMQPD